MDYNTNPQEKPPVYGADGEGFAQAAFVMGILSLISCRMLFLPMIFASIGAILAILSKGYHKSFTTKARNAFFIALAGIALNLALSVQTLSLMADQIQSGEFEQQFYEMYEEIYGVPFDASLNVTGGDTL